MLSSPGWGPEFRGQRRWTWRLVLHRHCASVSPPAALLSLRVPKEPEHKGGRGRDAAGGSKQEWTDGGRAGVGRLRAAWTSVGSLGQGCSGSAALEEGQEVIATAARQPRRAQVREQLIWVAQLREQLQAAEAPQRTAGRRTQPALWD